MVAKRGLGFAQERGAPPKHPYPPDFEGTPNAGEGVLAPWTDHYSLAGRSWLTIKCFVATTRLQVS